MEVCWGSGRMDVRMNGWMDAVPCCSAYPAVRLPGDAPPSVGGHLTSGSGWAFAAGLPFDRFHWRRAWMCRQFGGTPGQEARAGKPTGLQGRAALENQVGNGEGRGAEGTGGLTTRWQGAVLVAAARSLWRGG